MMFDMLLRCINLRCPVCGRSSIVERPFNIKRACSSCNALFKREEGFFTGAMLINVITTEVVILAIYAGSLVVMGFDYEFVYPILLGVGLLFPFAFYHHSWSLWLSFNNLVDPLPKSLNHT
jgi:hypothetical protein